jgi:predicted RNA-binding protein YlqC (UPF0109 family)
VSDAPVEAADEAVAETETDPTHAVAVLTHIARSLVDVPDEVRVDVDHRGQRPQLNLRVADGDMGRIIGKRGRMANAIRTVTRAAASRDGVEIDVEFVD